MATKFFIKTEVEKEYLILNLDIPNYKYSNFILKNMDLK